MLLFCSMLHDCRTQLFVWRRSWDEWNQMCYNPLEEEEEGKKKGYKQCTYETTFEGPVMHVMV